MGGRLCELAACLQVRRMRNKKMWRLAALAAVCVLASGCGAGTTTAETAVTESAAAGPTSAESTTGEPTATESTSTEPTSAEPTATEPIAAKPSAAASGGTTGQVAAADETISPVQVVEEGMSPIYGNELKDGTYPITVDSSSSMFHITDCLLTVADGQMEAVMTMSGTGYLKLYMGTGEEAAVAAETDFIPFEEDESGVHTFRIPVEALDAGINCSAFSKSKEKWYDRVLVFRSDSLPIEAFAGEKFVTAESLGLEDGVYTAEVILEGGSGKASVKSPADMRVEDGKLYATIVWGSANYDYMVVNDEKYEWAGGEEYSTFEIPVAGFDWRIPVVADTIAMSVPHEISYTLTFDSSTLEKAE